MIYTFDIGGTSTRSGVLIDNNMSLVGIEPTPKSATFCGGDSTAVASLLQAFYFDMVARYPLPDAVAVAVNGRLCLVDDAGAVRPGSLNGKDLVLSSPNIAGLNNIAFMRFLEDLGWNVPFHVENDANAALRSVTRHPTALSINMGAGVAAAVKRNGKIQHFESSWSCYEIGHGLRTVYPDDLTMRCTCGAFGCLEAIIGSRSLAMRYRTAPENADAATYQAMRDDVVTYLAPAIGDAVLATRCNVVILSGRTILGFSENFDMIAALKQRLEITHSDLGSIQFEISMLPDTAGMSGAALALVDNGVLDPQFAITA